MQYSQQLSDVDSNESEASTALTTSRPSNPSSPSSASNTPANESQIDYNPKAQLFVHEWLAIAIILGFLLLLTLIAAIGQSQDHEAHKTVPGNYLKPQEIEFHIEGAVAKPGIYRVKVGTKLKEAIILAEPLLEADLRKIKPASRVRNGQKVVLATREMISISVSGAVQEGVTLSVPKGLRLNELSKYVKFTDDADIEKVKSKRHIKNQEKIEVPSKHSVAIPRKGIRKKNVKK
ncbi:MAG: SLBB domain-containing protein [Parachlamydiaceae bacterium]|nr:SLBB domain-containing protein [Parachlamydiaceae bacterium]